jgi:O-antigen/teichoic acid export membrane protein
MTGNAAQDPTPRHRGARLYFAATTVVQVLALLRYVALARLLGPEQLGLAAILGLTASFFDLVTDTGADRFLIQTRDGEKASVQGLVQVATIARGITIAGLLVILAWPISRLYRAPELFGALAFLALPPLITGFSHLDMRRMQRRLDFRTEGWGLLISETLGLVATLAAAFVTHSFTAVVYGLIVRAVAVTVVTHARSERKYSVSFDRAYVPDLARFAAPLMLNGLLLFMGSESDRVIVGSMLDVKNLGLYSAVLLLIYFPSATLLRYLQAMYLPMVSSSRTLAERRDAANLLGGQSILLAMLMATGFLMTMPIVVPLLYGDRFAQSLLTFALIGVLQSSRFLILWPNTVAMGDGRSTVVLAANVVRLIGIPAGIVGVSLTGRLEGLVAGFVLGEWAAVASGLAMTRGLIGRSPGTAERLLAFLAASILVVGWAGALEAQAGQVEKVLTVASALLVWWILQREHVTFSQSFQLLRRLTARAAQPESATDRRIEGAFDPP